MTTTIAPSAPSFVAASHLKAGKLASSSRVAIAAINSANWLCIHGSCNMTFLSIDESPDSTVKGILGLGEGYMYDMLATTAPMNQDLFVVGKRTDSAGWHAFNENAGGSGYNPYGGSADEGISIVRGVHDGAANGSTSSVYGTFVSYYGYILASMSFPNYYSTSGMVEKARSANQPIVSVFEDDAIGYAADGGSLQGAADLIKRAWEQHVRCAFSYRRELLLTSGDTSWFNLVDRAVGTSGYEIAFKGRELYDGDSTAYLHLFKRANPSGLQVRISTSKETITMSTGLSTDSDTVLVDCLSDDAITISLKNSTGGNVRLYSLSLMEWYSTSVE